MLREISWLEHTFGTRHSLLPTDRLALLKQVHSARVLRASSPGIIGEGDALITDSPGLMIAVRTADCIPILMADRRRKIVAAVHAGWRGTVSRVAVAALGEMGSKPEDVVIVIGPGIGVCCYEVGSEVARHFGSAERRNIDLAAANRQQLIAEGVPAANITDLRECTKCLPERYHSFRRDGAAAGRMISAIGIRP
jgi:YfiH family protein